MEKVPHLGPDGHNHDRQRSRRHLHLRAVPGPGRALGPGHTRGRGAVLEPEGAERLQHFRQQPERRGRFRILLHPRHHRLEPADVDEETPRHRRPARRGRVLRHQRHAQGEAARDARGPRRPHLGDLWHLPVDGDRDVSPDRLWVHPDVEASVGSDPVRQVWQSWLHDGRKLTGPVR